MKLKRRSFLKTALLAVSAFAVFNTQSDLEAVELEDAPIDIEGKWEPPKVHLEGLCPKCGWADVVEPIEIENRLVTFHPDPKGRGMFCPECNSPISALRTVVDEMPEDHALMIWIESPMMMVQR